MRLHACTVDRETIIYVPAGEPRVYTVSTVTVDETSYRVCSQCRRCAPYPGDGIAVSGMRSIYRPGGPARAPRRPTLTFGSTAPDRHPERARRTVRRGGRRRPAGSVTPPQVCGNVRIVVAYLERGRRAACGRGPPGLVKTSNPQLFLRLVVQHPSSDVPFHATANSPG